MNPSPESPLYQLVLLWLRDAPRFETYCELAAPVVRPYGGALDLQVLPTAIYADGLERPDVVNLVHYASRVAYRDFLRDQRFLDIVHLRSSSVSMISVEGESIREGDVPAPGADAVYLVEIARFGSAGALAYRKYEEEAEPVFARYGYRVGRVLRPESSAGLAFTPDIVKVAYFDSAEGLARLHADPAHGRLEGELYPAAVDASVWLVGSSAPPAPPHPA